MPAEPASEAVIPSGWVHDFLRQADLVASYRALAGHQHFYAETMRGRVRSLELRFEEARAHFARAEQLSEAAPRTIPNLIRRFALSVYTFECCLVEAPLDLESSPPDLWIPDIPEKLFREYPEVRLVVNLRKAVEGALRLHQGESARAATIYEELVSANREGPKDVIAPFYIGLAAAQHNLGQSGAARRNLENAGLAIRLEGNLINRGLSAGQLFGFHSYLGERPAAESWRDFLFQLKCPAATRELFIQRGTRLIERSTLLSRLVVL